jgi:hypothetical protein
MKKVSLILLLFTFGLVTKGFSQAEKTADFFAGKWEFLIEGTPQGDVKLVAELIRKDGKLGGQLSNPDTPDAEKIQITSIDEEANKIILYFTASGYDLNLAMTKIDEDNLKGTMFDMFEAKGLRLK